MSADQAWKDLQDSVVREILAEMGRKRMTGRELCKAAGLSVSHWSEMRNLKKPIRLRSLIAAAGAVGKKVRISLHSGSD